ncbi:MAG: MmcQ/YjbR family DNA-binding protein [Micromonosporaceae bacterium]|nr:MmcQ/YjbR family DNA-binding protein [Micromonosporaceae bacterium]
MVTADDVRRIAMALPRTTEGIVRDSVRWRIGRIVYAALSRDETQLGFGFPKEERVAMIEAEPDKFLMPHPRDLRYRWLEVRLAAIDEDELRELLTDAWRIVVSKKTAAQYDAAAGQPGGPVSGAG